jgi:hypothetical protein
VPVKKEPRDVGEGSIEGCASLILELLLLELLLLELLMSEVARLDIATSRADEM